MVARRGELRKVVKIDIYAFDCYLLPIHLETDLLYKTGDRETLL